MKFTKKNPLTSTVALLKEQQQKKALKTCCDTSLLPSLLVFRFFGSPQMTSVNLRHAKPTHMRRVV